MSIQLQSFHPYTDPIVIKKAQTCHLLNFIRWCHMANKFKS